MHIKNKLQSDLKCEDDIIYLDETEEEEVEEEVSIKENDIVTILIPDNDSDSQDKSDLIKEEISSMDITSSANPFVKFSTGSSNNNSDGLQIMLWQNEHLPVEASYFKLEDSCKTMPDKVLQVELDNLHEIYKNLQLSKTKSIQLENNEFAAKLYQPIVDSLMYLDTEKKSKSNMSELMKTTVVRLARVLLQYHLKKLQPDIFNSVMAEVARMIKTNKNINCSVTDVVESVKELTGKLNFMGLPKSPHVENFIFIVSASTITRKVTNTSTCDVSSSNDNNGLREEGCSPSIIDITDEN